MSRRSNRSSRRPGPRPSSWWRRHHPPGWKTIGRGKATITAEDRESELDKLAAMLRDANGRFRLVLNWTLERQEGSP